ncbi:MAG: hormogonium polysaccharide biosynthesis glycosyltransferase HpsE [Planktothrix sp.]|uniref:hormogonium polysaccharide biosynthesis glycosyltransferase HpsE n=1 Tax=Planktothrix sp. TaxID=3088171 RepID=UPI0038D3C3C8
MDFSIVIPTYNSENRISAVLEKLRLQQGTEQITWEIIVVDNNSSDRTAEVILNCQKQWDFQAPLRYVFEPKQGAGFARQRGVEIALGELIGCLDDDNLPECDWVLQSYLFSKEYPQAGAYGGQNHPIYQVEPPPNFQRIHGYLAIRENGDKPFLFCPEKLQLPAGAGLVVRKQAWLDHVPPVLENIDRGGEDYEISLNLYKGGWEIWYNPKMHLAHDLPAYRLEKNYLLYLAHTYGLKSCLLLMLITPTWKKPILFFKTFLGGIRRSIAHQIKYKDQIKTDIVAACELQFFQSSVLSPFYYLKKKLSINSKF